MASKARPGGAPEPTPPRRRRGWREPLAGAGGRRNGEGRANGPGDGQEEEVDQTQLFADRWAAPGPADDGGVVGPDTGYWDPRSEELEGEGTATWDGPMVWHQEDQGGPWDQGARWEAGREGWEPEAPPTTVTSWGTDQGWADPYGYETGYQTGYARTPDDSQTTYEEYEATVLAPAWDGDGAGGKRRRAGRGNGPWPELVMITAVAVIIAAVILAVTSADRGHLANSLTSPTTLGSGSPSSSTGAVQRSTTSLPARSSTTLAPTTTALKPTTTTPKTKQKAVNLLVTAGVKNSLVQSWISTNPGGVDLAANDVAGTEPGQVYYAEQPASKTYWALVEFKPSATLLAETPATARQEKLAQFQDSTYAFSWESGPVWTLLGELSTGSCPQVVPSPVLAAWGMCGL